MASPRSQRRTVETLIAAALASSSCVMSSRARASRHIEDVSAILVWFIVCPCFAPNH
jgi:hypothetical protein